MAEILREHKLIQGILVLAFVNLSAGYFFNAMLFQRQQQIFASDVNLKDSRLS